MEIRITVSYPATDGSMPESADVVFEDATVAEARDLLPVVIEALLRAPSVRYAAPPPRPLRFRSEGCRRPGCGHPAQVHADFAPGGTLCDVGSGMCTRCGVDGCCPTFVGEEESK